MAQNEQILWDVLGLLFGHSVEWTTQTAGNEPNSHTIENAFAAATLKGELVLRYIPADIEDTIYFLKYREYLVVHGHGLMLPEYVYSLTEKAIEVHVNRQLPEEEEKAFQESLWEIKPRVYGIGPNLPEFLKRWRKLFSRK
jgi:hypothetical protein